MAKGNKNPVVMASTRAVNGGIATLDTNGNVPCEQLGNVTNPNLLDNWHFANPVNQRGQTEYTGTGYGIDRWKNNGEGTVTVGNGCVTVSNVQEFERGLIQSIEPKLYDTIKGKQVTFSCLLADNTLLYCTVTAPDDGHVRFDFTDSFSFYMDGVPEAWGRYVALVIQPGYTLAVTAVKLELGSVQTLAHQEADGGWVLNEIPDYSRELCKCKRFYERKMVAGLDTMELTGTRTFLSGVMYEAVKATVPVVKIYGRNYAEPDVLIQNEVIKMSDGNVAGIPVTDLYVDAEGIHYVRMADSLPEVNSYSYIYEASAEL